MNNTTMRMETLGTCQVQVTDGGKVVIVPQAEQQQTLERLREEVFRKKVPGSMSVQEGALVFEPYKQGLRQPTFVKKEVVGQTVVQVTAKQAKFSLSLPRATSKDIMCLTLMQEVSEVVRRLTDELYESMVRLPRTANLEAQDTQNTQKAQKAQDTQKYNTNPQNAA